MSDLIKFLLGEGEYEGAWFGEKAKQEKGAYWWRKYLRKYTDDQATEIEQLKAQNMAMSEVVGAAEQAEDYLTLLSSSSALELGKALATYKQTMEG